MAKSGKMWHKQIMAMNGTSFNNWPKQLNFKNGVNVLSFPQNKTLSATYIGCRRKKQYFLPD